MLGVGFVAAAAEDLSREEVGVAGGASQRSTRVSSILLSSSHNEKPGLWNANDSTGSLGAIVSLWSRGRPLLRSTPVGVVTVADLGAPKVVVVGWPAASKCQWDQSPPCGNVVDPSYDLHQWV